MSFKWKRLLNFECFTVCLGFAILFGTIIYAAKDCGQANRDYLRRSELCLQTCQVKFGDDISANLERYPEPGLSPCICDLTHRRMDMSK